ncbi:MAG: hypothetical protein WCY36_01675 [Candidatus Omnitrophota bacterium]
MVFKKDEPMIKKDFIGRLVFFIGWLLSPLTFWNDAFVNIPISYIAAAFLFRFIHTDFLFIVLICYWLSNILGLVLMVIAGKSIFASGRGVLKEIVILVATMLIYSTVLLGLEKVGILKPF